MDFMEFLQRRESSEITRSRAKKSCRLRKKTIPAIDFGWQFRGGNFGVAISGWPFWVAQRFSAAITDLVLNGGFSR
jgi:hypothetical protein